ncbi:MAG: hypothetical protein ACI92I_000916 [Acidimicrobiales bacterium]|jgi:hypothetical protein
MDKDPIKEDGPDNIEKVMSEFGGRLNEVPEVRLERLGYVLVESETGTRIMKISAYEKSQREATERAEKIPFDKVVIEFESDARTGLIHEVDFSSLHNSIDWFTESSRDSFMYDDAEKAFKTVYCADNKLIALYQSVSKLAGEKRLPLLNQADDSDLEAQILFADTHFGAIDRVLSESGYSKKLSELNDLLYDLEAAIEDDPEEVPKQERIGQVTEKIDTLLQFMTGKYGDVDIFNSAFSKELSERSNDDDNWSEDFDTQDKITPLDLIKEAIIVIYNDLELPELAKKVASVTSLDELTAEVPTIAPITQRQMELQSGIKDKSLDPRDVSGEFSELKRKRKKNQSILEGIKDLTRLPELQAQSVIDKLDRFRGKLFNADKDGKRRINRFTLDGKPDKELDKDPGSISGDCTEGKPLPFNHKDIDLFNIKVFGSKNEHVGNIYLLQTTLGGNYDYLEEINPKLKEFMENGEDSELKTTPVWHLEAVQIISGAQWDDAAIRKFFQTLNQAAERKGVHGITLNTGRDQISNHRSISEPFLSWLESSPEVINTNVVIPRVNQSDIVSGFQGQGEAFFVPNKLYFDKETREGDFD